MKFRDLSLPIIIVIISIVTAIALITSHFQGYKEKTIQENIEEKNDKSQDIFNSDTSDNILVS